MNVSKKIKQQLASKALLLALLAGSIALLTSGACLLYVTIDFEKHALAAQGTVTEMTSDKEQLPVIEFLTPDGKLHTFSSSLFSSSANYRMGEKVALLYDPSDITRTAVAGKIWKAPKTILGCGLLLLLFNASCYFFLARKPAPRSFARLIITH